MRFLFTLRLNRTSTLYGNHDLHEQKQKKKWKKKSLKLIFYMHLKRNKVAFSFYCKLAQRVEIIIHDRFIAKEVFRVLSKEMPTHKFHRVVNPTLLHKASNLVSF